MKSLPLLGPLVAILDTSCVAPASKQANPFYLTRAWRELVRRLIQLRGRRCEKCKRTGCRIFGDHVVELEDGGAPLDPANVELLCGSCHTTKTHAARVARQLATPDRQGDEGGIGPVAEPQGEGV